MDFYCQRCGKTVEIDESLLRIDLPLGDLARGEIDFDRIFAKATTSSTFSSASMRSSSSRISTFSSTASTASASSDRSSKGLGSASAVTPPRRTQQTESPIPRGLASSFTANRPSKNSTILLKVEKPPPTLSSLSTSNPSSSSSSTSPTSPSPTSSAIPPTPTTKSPPHYSQSAQPSHFSHIYNSTTNSNLNSNSNVNANAIQKSRSEFFGFGNLNRSSDGVPPMNGAAARNKTLTQSQSGIYSTQPANSPDTVYGSLSQVSGLKYIRDSRRTLRKASDIFDTTQNTQNQTQNPTLPSQQPPNMPTYPSAPNLHQHMSAAPSPTHSINPADAQHATKLFQLVSEQLGVDLPLCGECTKTLTSDLDDELALLESQNTSYMYYMEQLEQKEKKWPSMSDVDEEIEKLEEEEEELRRQIASLHEQKQQVSEEVARLKTEAGKLVNFEERYWLNFDELHAALSFFVDERDACKVQTTYTREMLRRTQRTQIINDAFHIWHDGHFGTVNTFRLGRLPSQPVDWNEINAAWGLATLLLYNMARRIGFQFSTYRLVPAGSCSKMERIDNNSPYELFGSSDISLGRLFWYRRFDNGMVAFLMCLKEMGDFAESRDKSFRLPHKMEKDKVGDMSIKIQFNNEETWTKSLKYTLTNLKWLLAWVVRMEAEQVASKNGVVLSANGSSASSANSSLSSVNSNSSSTITNNNNNVNNNSVNNNTTTVNTTHSINNPPTTTTQSRGRFTMLFSRSGSTTSNNNNA